MTKKIPLPEKENLVNLYNQYGTTISSLARHYGTTQPTVRSWLKFYEIKRKSHQQASTEANNRDRLSKVPTKESLEDLYSKMSLNDLEAYYSVGQDTIYEWLHQHNIPTKSLSDACKQGKARHWEEKIPSKKDFVLAYSECKNLKTLQDKFNLCSGSIRRLCREYDIEVVKPWRSAAEIRLFDELNSTTNLVWQSSDKTLINPYELDIICPERNLAVEYCGLYWHSELSANKTRDYHLKKLNRCQKKNYNLITIFESDDITKVLDHIKSRVGLVQKIGARDCIVQELDTAIARAFNDQYHVHNHHSGSVNLGLYHAGELLMCLVMGKSRFSSNYQWECVRMTSRAGYQVLGGASKLFKHFIRTKQPESIITFADRRFGEGKVYESCGFEFVENTGPNYWYFKKGETKLHSRVKFQKHKLTELSGYSSDLTEWQIMQLSGYDRIWDCGNAKWVWRK